MTRKSAEDKIKELADVAKKRSKKATDAVAKAASKFTVKEEAFVQYGNYEIRVRDIIDRAKSDYIAKGHEEKDIKEIQVYIKPADNAVYYVVNSTDTGKLSV